jgi:hypothetical protein
MEMRGMIKGVEVFGERVMDKDPGRYPWQVGPRQI